MNRYLLSLLLVLCFSMQANAQFYNGLHMTFGKNRIQYNDFYWQYYRFERFDTYFYVNGKELGQYAAKTIEKEMIDIEHYLGYSLEKRIIFIIYNRLTDFRQSNIGLMTGDDQYNIGGATQIVDNKVFLYFEGDHELFRQQIRAAIARVIIGQMLKGENMRERLTSAQMMNFPEWYTEGLIEFIAKGWDDQSETIMRDAIATNTMRKFNHLTGKQAVVGGQSVWNFIATRYGPAYIVEILYMAKIYKNIDSGFLKAVGLSLKDLTPEWIEFYQMKYEDDSFERNTSPLNKRYKRNVRYYEAKASPDGRYVAWATNRQGKYKVFLQDIEKGKTRKVFRKGHRLEQINDYTMPVIEWHPRSELLAFITEEEGKIWLNSFFPETGELKRRQMLYFQKILEFEYSSDGLNLVMSVVQKGQVDIVVFNIVSGTHRKITDDPADDRAPRFINNSKDIVFASTRTTDSIFAGQGQSAKNYDLFISDAGGKNKVLKRLSNTPFDNEKLPFELGKNRYVYLSNGNGIYNRYIASYDSIISYIDTAIHYNYFSKNYAISNYPNNIVSHSIARQQKKLYEVFYEQNRYKIMTGDADFSLSDSLQLKDTYFKQKNKAMTAYKDSLKALEHLYRQKFIESSESLQNSRQKTDSLVDINNYVFSSDVDHVFEKKAESPFADDSGPKGLSEQRVYLRSFYVNNIVSQVDFGFLNASYQTYTGGAVYFNPGFNALFKIGANDLFEDYKLIGGVRFAGNFDSNEYLLSLENLADRWDKQYIFHRQVFSEVSENWTYTKVRSHELMYLLKYPFNQVSAVRATFGLRSDYNSILSTDFMHLQLPDSYKTFASIKLEYIFDNSINRGLNLYEGVRGKAWAEFYKQIDGAQTDLYVLGMDLRTYTKIHRNLIWANRIAGSKSLGKSRLLYYMGSTDNWINFSPVTPTFIDTSEVRVNTSIDWAFQSLATNMRGWAQNIRNGDAFVVINSEIRWPVFRYFANHPLNSDFLDNFQAIGFLDIGTAWTGLTPWAPENWYLNKIISNNSVTVIIDKQRGPFVAGTGFGFRSRLMGYFVRADWAWGIENNVIMPGIFHLSLSLDF